MTGMEATRQLRQWFRDKIEGSSQVDIQQLTQECWQHFSKDKTFVAALIDERILRWLADECRYLIGQQRMMVDPGNQRIEGTGDDPDPLIPVGAGFERKSSIKERASKRAIFLRWKEHVGPSTYVSLTSMTKDQLLIAVGYRTDSANQNLRTAAFLQTLASGLKAGQKVGDKFDTDKLAEIWENVNQQYRTETA